MTSSPDIRSQQRFDHFQKALGLYEEAARPGLSKLEQEGLIQRFEYTFELAWKCLQDLLHERGYAGVRGPRPVIEQAFQDGIISNGPLWFEMLKSRNETTHLYSEEIFRAIIAKVAGEYLPALQKFRVEFARGAQG
jgi:nucleotidyltransferase substrate binding protein (TIGR01987 family)